MSMLALLIHAGTGQLGGGPGGVPNTIFWVRADKPNPAPASIVLSTTGSLVDIWYDQSTLDHHVYGSGSSRPLEVPNAVVCGGSYSSVDFDGSNDYMQSNVLASPYTMSGVPSFAVHIAFRASNNTDATLFSIANTNSARDGISVSLIPNGIIGRTTLALDCGGSGEYVPALMTIPIGGIYSSGVHTVSLLFDASLPSDNLRLFFDTNDIAVSLLTTHVFAATETILLGRSPIGHYFNGEILEVVLQRSASVSDQSIIHTYYQNKWCSA